MVFLKYNSFFTWTKSSIHIQTGMHYRYISSMYVCTVCVYVCMRVCVCMYVCICTVCMGKEVPRKESVDSVESRMPPRSL